jgi:hypothetical protein
LASFGRGQSGGGKGDTARRFADRAEAHLARVAGEHEAKQPGLSAAWSDLEIEAAAIATADRPRRAAGVLGCGYCPRRQLPAASRCCTHAVLLSLEAG